MGNEWDMGRLQIAGKGELELGAKGTTGQLRHLPQALGREKGKVSREGISPGSWLQASCLSSHSTLGSVL